MYFIAILTPEEINRQVLEWNAMGRAPVEVTCAQAWRAPTSRSRH